MENPIVAYYPSTYTQGMATYPCFVVIRELNSEIRHSPRVTDELRAVPRLTWKQVMAIDQSAFENNPHPGVVPTWEEMAERQARHHANVLEICRS